MQGADGVVRVETIDTGIRFLFAIQPLLSNDKVMGDGIKLERRQQRILPAGPYIFPPVMDERSKKHS